MTLRQYRRAQVREAVAMWCIALLGIGCVLTVLTVGCELVAEVWRR